MEPHDFPLLFKIYVFSILPIAQLFQEGGVHFYKRSVTERNAEKKRGLRFLICSFESFFNDSFFIAKVYFNILYSAILVVEYYRYMVVIRASVTLEDFTSPVVFDILPVAMKDPIPQLQSSIPYLSGEKTRGQSYL